MKSVLISIQPKWCELIASGKKTIEVRKTKPKLETPFKVYIYCTKGETVYLPRDIFGNEALNGKVIGEFVCDKIINIPYIMPYDSEDTSHPMRIDFIHETCVPDWEIDEYLGRKDGYGWHISDLVIYDKPRELCDFINYDKHEACLKKNCFSGNCWICPNNAIVVRPPQSWCYVESEDTE